MIAVIQRVRSAAVTVDNKTISSIDHGILTLLGIEKGDGLAQLEKMIQKILQLRIFEDEQGKMNLNIQDVQGEHLIVSQFTLAGDCSKGNRPSFGNSEDPQKAKELYEKAIALSQSLGTPTQGGQFAATMLVDIKNDGPVTFVLKF